MSHTLLEYRIKSFGDLFVFVVEHGAVGDSSTIPSPRGSGFCDSYVRVFNVFVNECGPLGIGLDHVGGVLGCEPSGRRRCGGG